jgi:hypothetical protein
VGDRDVARRAEADRDYMADMAALINRILDQDNPDGIVPGVAAASLFHHLEDEDPDLLHGWATVRLLPALSEAISRQLSSRRSTANRRILSRAFGEAALSGDADLLAAFRAMHPVNELGLRKAACDMTGREHEFVAGTYERTGKTMLMVAEFHRQVGRKAGTRPLRDVMDAAQYGRLLQSIVKRDRRGIAA